VSDAADLSARKRANGETMTIGEVLDAFAIIMVQEDESDDDLVTVDRNELKLVRPPPKRAVASAARRAMDEKRELEKAAMDLFVPVVARSRREREALDREASAVAAQFASADLDAEAWRSARRAAGRAPRTAFTGIHVRRPADVLYDALIAERTRKPWIAEPNPVVAVAAHIARDSLRDPTASPRAVLRLVTDSFFDTTGAPGDDLVARALNSARLVLDALLRYHPALASRREAVVAALESVDAAILGGDRDDVSFGAGDDDDHRELRYQAVLATLQAQVPQIPDDDIFAADPKKSPTAASLAALAALAASRSARGKLRALVATLEAIAADLGRVASDDLMPALCDTIARADLRAPAAEVAFAKRFCRDEKLLLGADGYALTSFEIALVALSQQPGSARPSLERRSSSDARDRSTSVSRRASNNSDAVTEEIPATTR